MTINFYRCIQDSQEYGSTNEHMMSRVFFTIDGQEYECDVRQPYGENFSFEDNPIEVENPDPLKGRVKYEQFRDAVEEYYRLCVGSNAHRINIQGSSYVRMMNSTFNILHSAEVEEAGIDGAW